MAEQNKLVEELIEELHKIPHLSLPLNQEQMIAKHLIDQEYRKISQEKSPEIPLEKLPEEGKNYWFFDDGKSSSSRCYIASVFEIIPFSDASQDLIDDWRRDVKSCYWLYAEETDYFVKCQVFGYDENMIYFVRTKDGGWFSIARESFWQCGRLDVDGEKMRDILEENENYIEEVMEKYKVETPQ